MTSITSQGTISLLTRHRQRPQRLLVALAASACMANAANAQTMISTVTVPYNDWLQYDERGNVIQRTTGGLATAYRYDGLDRLRQEGAPGAQLFDLDADGSRLADGRSRYRIAPRAQRLAERDGVALVHGPAGHLLVDRAWLGGRWVQRSFDWTLEGQIKAVHMDGVLVATYVYNEARQRTRKVLVAPIAGVPAITLYRHDAEGRLVMEVAGSALSEPGVAVIPGQVLVRYLWQDSVPVAVVWPPMTPGNPNASTDRVVYLHTDHLNTPRRATDARGVVVWQWTSDAFGAHQPDDDVDRDGRRTVINLRFPGQYDDQESGLHYNWNRYYDPQVGRYTQSDPVGLAGGINTYAYVGSAPTMFTDPTGLFTSSTHNEITAAAIAIAGRPCPNLPGGVANADWFPGSQAPRNAHWHAMRDGTNPNATVVSARRDVGMFVDGQWKSCTCEGLARAMHAVQDSYARGHAGFQPWNGGMPSVGHARADAYPSKSEREEAIKASVDLIRRFGKDCKDQCPR